MTSFSERMNQAVLLARSGERETARGQFAQIVEEAPANFQAWLWLSELASTLEEQTAMLEAARRYAPEGEDGVIDLQPYLNELRGSLALPPPNSRGLPRRGDRAAPNPEELYRQVERLATIGRVHDAVQILNRLVHQNPKEEHAWLMLGELEPDLRTRVRALEIALDLRPENSEVSHRLAMLRPALTNPLLEGLYLEETGDDDGAMALYRAVAARTASQEERREALNRIRILERRRSRSADGLLPRMQQFLRAVAEPVRMLFF